jgi:hypothetical protein
MKERLEDIWMEILQMSKFEYLKRGSETLDTWMMS